MATLPDTGTAAHGFARWLLIRRSVTKPAELAYYLLRPDRHTSDEQLIGVAGTRWAIEECFQTAKGQVGLDEYHVRRYRPWYRHITLAMCAHAFLAITAAAAVEKGGSRSRRATNGLIPLTLAEVRPLLAQAAQPRPPPPLHARDDRTAQSSSLNDALLRSSWRRILKKA